MNEAQTRLDLIDPALREAGWTVVPESRIKVEVITDGRIIGKDHRGKRIRKKPLSCDYVLEYRGRRLAVIEAKARDKYYTDGLAQAKDYAHKLNTRYAYCTNGLEIYGVDMDEATEGDVVKYPTPDELWEMTYPTPKEAYKIEITNWKERFREVSFALFKGQYKPRYYQRTAVEKCLDAIAEKKDRLLLTMATGTGKTATAFHICWKLFHAKWNLKRDASRAPRILFLADRNILANQAFNSFNDFDTIDENIKKRISPSEIRKDGKVPKNGSIFFTIFQSFMTSSTSSLAGDDEFVESAVDEFIPLAAEEEVEYKINFKEIVEIDDAYGFMYILQCADGSFYVGSTKDLARRIKQHQNGEGGKYTKSHLPVKLVYYEKFDRIDLAFKREKQIQKWRRAKKVALINNDIELLKRLSSSTSSLDVDDEINGKLSTVNEPVEFNFKEYPADFFDFIIIDECHRGGANDESSWRDILEYFSPAVQLGLTATPKRTTNADTYEYFGDPIFTYSLKDGINDGFLSPFRVKQIQTNYDEYTFTSDDTIIRGEAKVGDTFTYKDYGRKIIIDQVERFRVRKFLSEINQNHKTLVFCATQDHALAIRDIINQESESKNTDYCQRVTADDGKMGEQALNYFCSDEYNIPTILTTSQKLSTGVDAREIRNIVLLRPVNSMIEFKQIIGRGTRLYDGKDYFTVYDFVKAHEHFKDPDWDGEPDPPEPPTEGGEKKTCEVCGKKRCTCNKLEPELCPECDNIPCICETPPSSMIKIRLSDGKTREIDATVKTTFWSPDGTPIGHEEFINQLYGELKGFLEDEEALRKIWSLPSTRKKLLEELKDKGYTDAQFEDLREIVKGKDSDLYDVLSFIAYNKHLVPRLERAEKAKIQLLDYDAKQQAFLNFVLEQYVRDGVDELDDKKLPELLELKYKAIADAKRELGSIKSIRESFIGFQEYLYKDKAI